MTPETSRRTAPSRLLAETPIVAVLRASDPRDYDAVVDVLIQNGVTSIELTLSTPGTLDHLPSLLARVGDSADIGVGTVTTSGEARRAIDGGARYLVTPIVRLDVIATAVAAGVAVYPGGLTPTELFSAWEAGASAVKIFPAETVGPQYGAHLRGPFPELDFIPSGGIAFGDIGAWLAAGATAVSLGGPLIGDALRGGSHDALAARAREAVALATEARGQESQ
jgi:2-dehydro-3-deoxyphosphogluconate aldolase/(4S)-4-hydroxy-2-oxoglutarate aldolase